MFIKLKLCLRPNFLCHLRILRTKNNAFEQIITNFNFRIQIEVSKIEILSITPK